MTLTLRDYQQDAIDGLYSYWADGRGDHPLIVMPTGCHGKGHPILMHDGTVKPVEDVAIGDQVMGPDSTPRTVVRLHRGTDQMYFVRPTKGEPFTVNSGHIFSVYRTPERGGHNPCPEEVTAGDFYHASEWFRHVRKLQRVAVSFPEAEQPVPPWVLGALIGDGCLTQAVPTFCTPDDEVVSEISEWAEGLGCTVNTTWGSSGKNAWDCSITDSRAHRGVENEARKALRSAGIYGGNAYEKFIPQSYKVASRDQRLELIAGLLDTDGHLSKGGYDWISASEALADDMVFLCRSVGLAAYKKECVKSCQNGFSGTYYRVSVSGDCNIVPCRVARRVAEPRKQVKRVDVTGMKLTPVGVGEYFGFELDGDHLYLDGYFVRHHNSGKSLVLAKLVQDALEFPGTHILMLTHVKELIAQNAAELKGILPDVDLGIYSAGLGQKRLDRQVTFAGIQSIWKRAYDMIPPPDLVIIDEAHLVPRNSETRYGKFLADLYECNPEAKIVGLTATPFRLDSGYLHKGNMALFDGIAYDVPVGRLIDEGWLAPVVSKGSSHQIDLTNVRMRGGEFVEGDLAMAASDPELVRATVAEIVSVGADRKSWLIFASGVDHANMIAAEMEGHGIDCEVITGGTAKTDRQERIEDFKAGRLRCLVNVNVLTTGFNAPCTDLVALVRATASTALYIQMVGRGTRTAPEKENCLVLDYGGNVLRHGLFDAVRVKEVKAGGGGDAPVKQCPECETMVPAGCNYCPQCAYKFPPPELNHGQAAYDGALTTDQVVAEWVEVSSVTYARHQKAGKTDSVRVTYHCGMRDFREWLCPDHGGYAASRYRARMPALGAEALTTNDALNEAEKFWTIPDRIKIKPRVDDPRYFEIIQLDYSGGRKPERRDEIDWEAGYEDAFDDAF